MLNIVPWFLYVVPCRCTTRQCAQKCSPYACAIVAAPSCSAAVYFHTVGSIPRVTKKSLIDDFQLSTRFSLSSIEWVHCQSVSFWSFRVAELKAKLAVQHRFCWHCSALHMHSRQNSKKVFPLAKKGGFTKAKHEGVSLTLKQEAMLYDCWLLRRDLEHHNCYWLCNNNNMIFKFSSVLQ